MWESATASEPRESTISSRSCASSSTHAGMQPSVLLISADDLPRNILGVYGAQHGLTPNIDALARSSGATVFDTALTGQALRRRPLDDCAA